MIVGECGTSVKDPSLPLAPHLCAIMSPILKQGKFVGSLDCGTTYGYDLPLDY